MPVTIPLRMRALAVKRRDMGPQAETWLTDIHAAFSESWDNIWLAGAARGGRAGEVGTVTKDSYDRLRSQDTLSLVFAVK